MEYLLATSLLSTGVIGLISQNTLYHPSLIYNNTAIFSYCVSLYICLLYVVILYHTTSIISIAYAQCLDIQSTNYHHTKTRKPFRKKRKRWKSYPHHDAAASDSVEDIFASPGVTTKHHQNLHQHHYGNLFEAHCRQCPQLIQLFGVQSPVVNSTLQKSNFIQHFTFVGSDNSTYDLTSIIDNSNPFRFQSAYMSTNGSSPIIFDTGASISISPYKEDFITFTEGSGNTTLQGVSASTVVSGSGTINLFVLDDNGNTKAITTKALYVPNAMVRLLSVQSYCRENKDGASMLIDGNCTKFTFPQSLGTSTITFKLSQTGNLPKVEATRFSLEASGLESSLYSLPVKSVPAYSVLSSQNKNLSTAQKLVLDLHWRLMHINIPWVHYLFRIGVFTSKIAGVTTATCKCEACQLGKQTRNTKGAINHQLKPSKVGSLKRQSLTPGAVVSTDQFVSSVRGRLPHTYGKENEREQYSGGTIFVDESSDFMFVSNQVSLNASETLIGKAKFEREALRHGIAIKSYRGDNGIFRSEEFQRDLHQKHQPMIYSGVGAHHHNGIAERAIRTVSTNARTMLLHSMIHWPAQTSLDLWPFAVEYAVYLWNLIPKHPSSLSPTELFYSVKSDHAELKRAKVWGCPTYVLDPRLQDGKKIPKWEPRSQLGQFVGRSSSHSSTVGLIRNISTGKVSPQFHTVFDNHFTTLSMSSIPDSTSISEEWKNLFTYQREYYFDPADFKSSAPPTTLPPPPPPTILQPSRGEVPAPSTIPSPTSPSRSISIAPEGASSPEGASAPSLLQSPLQSPSLSFPPSSPTSDRPPPSPSSDSVSIPTPAPPPQSPAPRRYPKRVRFPTNKPFFVTHYCFHENYAAYFNTCSSITPNDAYLVSNDFSTSTSLMTEQFDMLSQMKNDPIEIDNLQGFHPFAFASKVDADDSPKFHEAMSSPDREGFIEAMHLEIQQLESLNAWAVVNRSKAISEGRRILSSTWVFKRKRYPDGRIKKLKARICVRGDQQVQDVDYFDTFSPVVQWSTIRIMFILSIMLKLKTIQVDYTLAFVQAPADPGTYVEMPQLFQLPGKVLELKRNLYGQCESPRKFYDHLKNGLEQRGFSRSPHDHCLFTSKNVTVVTYVDDCIFFAKDEKSIKQVIQSLRQPPKHLKDKWHEFDLNEEEDYAGFLGIDISPPSDNPEVLELLQVGLIDRIISILGIDDKPKSGVLPASTTLLSKDENGPPRRASWKYASVVGMLLYLSSNSRPDIAFAVHQVARFTHCAKFSHEKAILQIGHYIQATRNKGLRINPNSSLNLELFADADFAGLWNIEHPDDAICVKSRTGYIITLGGVPVTWSSKLQTEIATSTMHAEYIALSTGMRELIPVKHCLEYLCKRLNIQRSPETKCIKVWEDNEGTIRLAGGPIEKVTPHTKHFAIKYHWFREKLGEHNIVIKYIDTKVQKADILTKGLSLKEFTVKRNLLMGW